MEKEVAEQAKHSETMHEADETRQKKKCLNRRP